MNLFISLAEICITHEGWFKIISSFLAIGSFLEKLFIGLQSSRLFRSLSRLSTEKFIYLVNYLYFCYNRSKMKCSACKNKACNWKYANRNYCLGKKEGIDCTCTCQVSDLKTVVASVVSFACGAALIGTGVALAMNPIGIATALCLNPIGIATLPLSGACIGGGSSMIITPFINKMNGEKMTFGNSGRNFLIGAGLGL